MEEEKKRHQCSGDCLKCSPIQRQYCSAQWSYNSMRMLEQLQANMELMDGTLQELQQKIDSIQGNEASLFDPTLHAQEGDGAETIETQNNSLNN